MKFSINKNILLEALNNVSKALSQKTTIPILNGIKFELTKEALSLTASDSELTIKVVIKEKEIVKIEKEGSAIVQSRYLLDIIRKMPSDVVSFDYVENKTKIYSEVNEFLLNSFEKEEYPNFKIDTNKNKIKIASSLMKDLLTCTTYAMSTQEIRPLLTGLNLKITGDVFECIATDSYRLSKKSITLKNELKEETNIVVPGKTVVELEKILEDDEDVTIYLFNNKVLFTYKNIYIQSNLLSGTYPETSHFIPKDFKYMIDLDLKVFHDAVDRASIFSNNKDKNIVRLNIKGKEMVISSSSSEIGKTEETIKIDSNKVENLEISISSRYLLEALRQVGGEKVFLLLNSDDKPVILRPVGEDSYTKLILPIKTF